MKKMNVKEMLIVGGTIIVLALSLNPKDLKTYETTTIIAKHVEKVGSVWYVDEIILDKAFKLGVFNPKSGDSINLELDSEGRVIGWKVKKINLLSTKDEENHE